MQRRILRPLERQATKQGRPRLRGVSPLICHLRTNDHILLRYYGWTVGTVVRYRSSSIVYFLTDSSPTASVRKHDAIYMTDRVSAHLCVVMDTSRHRSVRSQAHFLRRPRHSDLLSSNTTHAVAWPLAAIDHTLGQSDSPIDRPPLGCYLLLLRRAPYTQPSS